MREKYRFLAKNTALFFVASFLPKVLSFFMVPLYTSCLSTGDYGTADLLGNTVQLVMPLLTLQVQDAVMRFAMDSNYHKKDVLSCSFHIAVAGGGIFTAVLFALEALGVLHMQPAYIAFMLINYFTGSLSNIFSYFCRGIDKIKILTWGSVSMSMITIGCNLLFLLGFRWGLYGYLAANSIGALFQVCFLVVRAKLFRYIAWKKVPTTVRNEMIRFSIPMIFSALSWWVNNASDKYILNFFTGVSLVGIYAVSYKIPTILSALSAVIAKAFSISAIRELDVKDEDGFMGTSYTLIGFGMMLGCSALMLFNPFLARILFANDFYEAWHYVPPLLISVVFNQMSLTCENVFVALKRTKIVSITALAGAAINTAFNFMLIPRFGAYGAAVATAFGFGAVWAMRYWTLRKAVTLKIDLKIELLSYLLLILQVSFAYAGNRFLLVQLVLFAALLALHRHQIRIGWEKIQALRS